MASAGLPSGKAEATIWDSEVTGFGLRIRSGRKTFIVRYRPVGSGRLAHDRRVRLGSPPTIQTVAARALARAVLGKVAAGQDPAAERAAAKNRSRTIVSDLLDAYDRDLERRGYVNRRMVVAGLRTRLAGLLSRDITGIEAFEYAAVFEKLEASGRRGAAEDFRTKCRAFLSYAVTTAKVLPSNPLLGFRKQRATRADRISRDEHGHALDDAEIVRLWLAADPTTNFGRLIRFLLLEHFLRFSTREGFRV